jgi:hypothetical protein
MIHVDPILRISLMADAAGAITNGFNESVIIIIIRGMCWFHCKKSCYKQLLKLHDKDKRSDLIQGFVTLKLAQTPDIFRSASKLFIDEWSKDADDDIQVFIQYFKSEWIDNNSNWFESYNHPNDAGSTSNNNGNESINGLIKAEDLNDDINDDINYDAHSDEVLNNNYVSDEQNERAFDCGIDLDEIQNITNLVESLDADSTITLVDTIITPTSFLSNNPQVIQEKEHKKTI